MQNENRQNQTPHPQDADPTPRQNPPEDYVRMKDWIRQAQEEAERARREAERARGEAEDLKSELQDQGRSTKRAGWTAVVLALALVGASLYGYYALQEQGGMLGQLPIVQKYVDAVGERMTAAEDKLRVWAADWEGIGARITKMEQSVRSSFRAAKDYAQEQAAKVHHEVQAELDNRTKGLETKLSQLEVNQQEDRARLAVLQQDLTSARRELNQQIAQTQQETGGKLENLDGQISRNRRDLDDLNHQLERRRMDFELSKDQTREVAPGITVTLSDMNVSYQRVEGRIHVIPDGRILWVRGQSIQQPLIFYSLRDKRPYEVVFTRVNKDSAVGYVSMPLWPNSGVPMADNAPAVPSTTFVQ